MVDAPKTQSLANGDGEVATAGGSIPASHALAKAVVAALHSSASESSVHESFAYALASVHADRGLLVHVRAQDPLDLEVVCSQGYAATTGEAETAGVPFFGPCAAPVRECV